MFVCSADCDVTLYRSTCLERYVELFRGPLFANVYCFELCAAKRRQDWVKKCIEYGVEVPDQEVDQRKLDERLCKKTVRHVD